MTSLNQAESANSYDALGTIEIAPTVVESIAANATRQVEGVRAIRSMKGRFQDIFSKESGILLYQNATDEVLLEVFVEIKYGLSVPQVAQTLQQHLSEQIYFMTDIKLDAVNVHVVNLYIEHSK